MLTYIRTYITIYYRCTKYMRTRTHTRVHNVPLTPLQDEPDVGAPEGEDGENPQAKKLVPDSKLDKRLQVIRLSYTADVSTTGYLSLR